MNTKKIVWVWWRDKSTPDFFLADRVEVTGGVLCLSNNPPGPFPNELTGMAVPKGTEIISIMERLPVISIPIRDNIRCWFWKYADNEDLERQQNFFNATLDHSAL